MDIAVQFGKRLRELRTEKGKSPAEVATILGITTRALYYYEQGIREPSLSTIFALCRTFEVSADYLLGLTDI